MKRPIAAVLLCLASLVGHPPLLRADDAAEPGSGADGAKPYLLRVGLNMGVSIPGNQDLKLKRHDTRFFMLLIGIDYGL